MVKLLDRLSQLSLVQLMKLLAFQSVINKLLFALLMPMHMELDMREAVSIYRYKSAWSKPWKFPNQHPRSLMLLKLVILSQLGNELDLDLLLLVLNKLLPRMLLNQLNKQQGQFTPKLNLFIKLLTMTLNLYLNIYVSVLGLYSWCLTILKAQCWPDTHGNMLRPRPDHQCPRS